MTTSVDVVRSQIQREIKALKSELVRLEAALAALDPDPQAPPPSRRRPEPSKRSPGARRGTAKRAPRGANQDKILEHLAGHPEAAPKDIAQATGIAPNTVAATLSKLRRDGRLPSAA